MTPKIVTLPTLFALSLAPLAGCGDDPKPTADTAVSDSATVDTTRSDVSGADVALSPSGCLITAPTDITGTWAILETETALVTNVPGIGTMNQASLNYFLATVTEDGGALSMEAALCDWETSDDANLTTTNMSQALLNSLAPVSRSVAIEAGAEEARFKGAEGISLRGVTMTDPDADAFPADGTDARIYDQEVDAHPGITLFISGLFQGELYVAHRNRTAFDGCFKTDDRVEGASLWTTEQLIIGSNPDDLLTLQPTAQTHPDATLSKFTMVRAPGVIDCAALKAARSVLFAE